MILIATWLATPATSVEPGASEAWSAVSEASGTSLNISSGFAFASAALRVAGPDRYEAIAWSDGGPLALDLLANGFVSASDGESAGPLVTLPDGDYAYEAVFHLENGARRVHDGSFVVENGVVRAGPGERAISSRDGRAMPKTAEVTREGVVRSVAALTLANDGVQVADLAADGNTYLFLENELAEAWYVETDASGDLDLSSLHPAFLQPTLTLRANGDVSVRERRLGVGTTVPQADIQIFSPTGNIRITDSDPCPNANAAWEIEESSGRLLFDVVANCGGDSVGTKVSIHGDGDVGIGTLTPQARLHVAGSGIIDGDVALGSSRTIKHEIEPIEQRSVLHAIRELPIYSWKYKDDPDQAAHIGPMAEDVHAAFRLGRDEKHLSPADSAGLALAAIQGLDARLDRELEELRATNARLAAENATLRDKLLELEERLGILVAALEEDAESDRPAGAGVGGAAPGGVGSRR